MERKPTRPAPVTSSKKNRGKKTKTTEPDKQEQQEAIASITPNPEPAEKKQKREDITEEQFDQDTRHIFEGDEPNVYAFFGEPENKEAEELVQQSERFDELMAYYKSLPWYERDNKVDLAWLEENVGPLLDQSKQDLKDFYEAKEAMCPFHPSVSLECINPERENGAYFYKCPFNTCPVWCTGGTMFTVLIELKRNTHPDIRHKICMCESLQCKCGMIPDMKLSRTQKNPGRVFLTCGKRDKTVDPCGFFQWMHAPLWKPKRPYQPSLDQFQAKHPRWQTVETPQGEYFEDGQVREYQGRRYRPEMTSENRARLQQREKDWMNGFAQSAAKQTEQRADKAAFERACDRVNEQRKKHNCAPYSYETYRKFGLGIF